MRIVLVNKIPFLRLCRAELRIHVGVVDYHELIERLCDGIRSDVKDRIHIRNLLDDKELFPHNVASDRAMMLLSLILSKIRASVVRQIHEDAGYPKNQSIRFVRTGSKMSLRFKVFE